MTRTTRAGKARLGALLAAAALAAAIVGLPSPATPAGAQTCDGGTNPDDSGTTVEVGCGDNQPGGNGNANNSGESSGGGGSLDPAAVCAETYPHWADCVAVVSLNGIHPNDICGYVVAPWQDLLEYYEPDAPANAVLLYFLCPRDGVFYTEDTQWAPRGNVPQPPTPAEVARDIWVDVQTRLEEPSVMSSPRDDLASVIDVPTFVAVGNWQGPITQGDCQVGVCVQLTATPTLRFDPGEPDSEPMACDPPGTRFDPDGPTAEKQAEAPGACAHAYRHRSGVGSRPAAWPGVVSIEWEVSWEATNGSQQGSFDPIVLSTDVPRPVDDVTGLVTGVEVGL